MSKTFAGAAATLLVEQNLQSWETRISDMFPDLRLGNGVSYRSITLKQVASHSTGLMPHSYSNLLDEASAMNALKTDSLTSLRCVSREDAMATKTWFFPHRDVVEKVPAPVTGNTSKSRYSDH